MSAGIGTRLHELINAGNLDEYAQLRQQALGNGMDIKLIEEAEALHIKHKAMEELNAKVYKNPDIMSGNSEYGTPEVVNVDECVKALQRLHDDTSAFLPWQTDNLSHLEWALGKEGADKLLRDMYAAQRLGVEAARKRKIAIGISILIVVVVIVVAIIFG